MGYPFSFVLVTMVLILMGCGQSIQFDSSVPDEQRNIIEKDLENILSLCEVPLSQEDEYVLGLKRFEGGVLSAWLRGRVKYIVGESYDLEEQFELTEEPLKSPESKSLQEVPPVQALGVTVMTNIGGLAYLVGKEQGSVVRMAVAGSTVYARSPLVGVVQIGEGLFGVQIPNSPVESFANSINRIGTYFHEAHHGNGNGANAAFPHAKCLSGKLEDKHACDLNLNGPYPLGALVIEKATQCCSDCNDTELQALALEAADNRSRVLPEAEFRDPTPEVAGNGDFESP